MRILRKRLAYLALPTSAFVFGYDISIQPIGRYTIQIDGEVAEEKYLSYNAAISAAMTASLQCAECAVVVVPPTMRVSAEEKAATPTPESPTAYYAYALTESGALQTYTILQGAVLEPTTTYIEWLGGNVRSVSNWCCRTATLPYDYRAVTTVDNSNRYQLNLGLYEGSTEVHELTSDVRQNNDLPPLWSVRNFFEIENGGGIPPPIDPPPIDPPPIDPPTMDTTLEWTIPSEREDGDPLPLEDLSGYEISYGADGTRERILISNAAITEFEFLELTGGNWEFQVRAVDKTPTTPCPDAQGLDSSQLESISGTCGGPLFSTWSNEVTLQVR